MPPIDRPEVWEKLMREYDVDVSVCRQWVVLYCTNTYYKVKAMHILNELIGQSRSGDVQNASAFVEGRQTTGLIPLLPTRANTQIARGEQRWV